MRRFTHSSRFTVTALALAALLLATGVPTAWAVPQPSSAINVNVDPSTQAFRDQLAEKQARLSAFRAQLDALDSDLEVAAESYDQAQGQLVQIQERLDVTKQDLAAATAALDAQQKLLDERVAAMYKDGNTSSAAMLLDAKSIPDFFQRLEFIRTISSADANLATQLDSQRTQIASQEQELQNSETQAAALEFALRAKKQEIQLQIADREAMLASTQGDLVAMLNSEAAVRSTQETVLWQQIMSGASQVGVKVLAQSPVETALSYHGIPYVWGGASPSGFDCSGLTQYVYQQHGVSLPHHAADQYLLGTAVAATNLQPGDLVFFGNPIHHVGIYIGAGYICDAPHTGDYVKVQKLSDFPDYTGARRYAWIPRIGAPMGVSGVSAPSNLPKALR